MSYMSYPGAALGATGLAAQGTVSKAGVAVTGGPLGIFTVTGEVRIAQLYGIVTTAIGAVATSIRLTNVVPGTDTDITNATAITSAALGTIFDAPMIPGGSLRVSTGQGAILAAAQAFICGTGVISVIVASGGTTGAVDWYCVWQPMTAGATVVAAP